MLVDVSACYDVRTRYRHEIIIFHVPRSWCVSAYNEDDLAGENRTCHFGADKIFVPITSVPITNILYEQILTLRHKRTELPVRKQDNHTLHAHPLHIHN